MANVRPEIATSAASSFDDDFEKLSLTTVHHFAVPSKIVSSNDFVDGYENPVAWHKNYKVRRDQLEKKDVLFDNMDMRNITLAQYGQQDHDYPEYVKWKLFGYNIVICYEYIAKGKADKALETIRDIENILFSIGIKDQLLMSIRVALNHITFSLKGHVMKLCSLETTDLEHFIMPNNMNNANKAGLFGVQSLFFYEYGLPCAHIAKESAQKAISLNKTESEWYFLMARVLTHWQRTCGSYFECSEQEIHASEMAVELGNKDHHKLHLIHIYHRMSKNMGYINTDTKNKILDEGLRLVNEVMNNTNDFLLLKNCLLSLSKISIDKNSNKNIDEMLEKLIGKLESSDNGYVHGAIGNYYLFNKKDYVKANFHLKKAFDVKSFGCSIDYIYTLYKMNPETAPVEPMLVDMLKTFTHPVHREKILSQIVSYLMITKNDLIQALKYVPALLSIKNVTCIYSMQTHRLKFSLQHKAVDLLAILSGKIDAALNDPALTDHKKRITEVQQLLGPYKIYVNDLMEKKEHIFGNNFKKNSKTENNISPFNNHKDHKESWTHNNYKQDTTTVKNKDEGNWRTLKPDPNPNPHVFSRGFNKQISNNGMEIKSRFNSKK